MTSAYMERKTANDHWGSNGSVLSNSTCVRLYAPVRMKEISFDLERGGDAEDVV